MWVVASMPARCHVSGTRGHAWGGRDMASPTARRPLQRQAMTSGRKSGSTLLHQGRASRVECGSCDGRPGWRRNCAGLLDVQTRRTGF